MLIEFIVGHRSHHRLPAMVMVRLWIHQGISTLAWEVLFSSSPVRQLLARYHYHIISHGTFCLCIRIICVNHCYANHCYVDHCGQIISGMSVNMFANGCLQRRQSIKSFVFQSFMVYFLVSLLVHGPFMDLKKDQ